MIQRLFIISILIILVFYSIVINSNDCEPCNCAFPGFHISASKLNFTLHCDNASLTSQQYREIFSVDSYVTFTRRSSFKFGEIPLNGRQHTLEITVTNSTIESLDLIGYDNLQKLELKNNKIIGKQQIAEIPNSLKELHAESSSINSLHFQKDMHLTKLRLPNNVFVEIVAFTNLTELDLAANKIQDFRTNYCILMKNLTYFNLSRNLITEITDASFNCFLPRDSVVGPNLTLILSWNRIENVQANAFKGLHLSQIDLSHNNLKHIDTHQLNWRRLDVANLQFNPWRCDCSAQWMLDDLMPMLYINQQNVLHELRCQSPRQFEGKQLVYWYNRSAEIFCGAPETIFVDLPGGREIEIWTTTFITVIIFGILNIILLISIVVVCIVYWPSKKRKRRPPTKRFSTASPSYSIIQNRASVKSYKEDDSFYNV